MPWRPTRSLPPGPTAPGSLHVRVTPYIRMSSALEEVGISYDNHRARRVVEAVLADSELVLTMTPQHADELREHFPEQSPKLHVLPVYADLALGSIPDPHGRTIPAYRTSVRQLSECIERVMENLAKEQMLD